MKIQSKSGVDSILSVVKAYPIVGSWEAVTDEEKQGVSLYVGTGGDLSVTLVGDVDTIVTFKNVPSGAFIPVHAVKVDSTSTARDILILL